MSTLYGTVQYGMTHAPPRAVSGPTVGGYPHGRVPRELRERQLIDVAEEVFTELGFDGASIEEVSRRSGIKRPLFYTYFGGKDGLYLACYRRARAEMDARIAGAAAEVDPAAPDAGRVMVERVARAYFEFLATSPSRWDMLYGAGVAAAGPIADEVGRLRFQTVELLGDAFTRFARPGTEPRTILAFAHAASGAGEQLGRWWRRTPDLPLDDLVELAAEYIWGGLAPILSAPSAPSAS
jgi:AcrR family transcriptional regulator